MAGERRVHPGGRAAARRAALRHHHASAERHRLAAHRPRLVRDRRGHPDPLPPDARRRRCGSRRGSRGDRGPVRARQDAGGGGPGPGHARPRGLPRPDVGLHERDPRGHLPPAAAPGRQRGLDRNRFTMDEGSARAVRVAFKRLWDAGYVYRGEAMVNWCPRCRPRSATSRTSIATRSGTGTIRYHLAAEVAHLPGSVGGGGHHPARPSSATWRSRFIPTTSGTGSRSGRGRSSVPRPPADHRRRGRRPGVRHRGGQDHPAHDPDDYETGKRHGLPPITVLDEEARINDAGGEFARPRPLRSAAPNRRAPDGDGRPRGRTAAPDGRRPLRAVRNGGRATAVGPVVHPHRRPRRPSPRIGPRGPTKIVPPRFEKVYAHWMENIRDWAVGRQLWWGHRIPAWFCPDGHITVSDGPRACDTCGRPAGELVQESDIFDTWFSSGLWPFSTLAGPTTRRTCAGSTRHRSWRPATTSCSSGWRG